MHKLIQKIILALLCVSGHALHAKSSMTRTALNTGTGLVYNTWNKAPELAAQAVQLIKTNPGKSLYAASVVGAATYGYLRYSKYDREVARIRKSIAPWQAKRERLAERIHNNPADAQAQEELKAVREDREFAALAAQLPRARNRADAAHRSISIREFLKFSLAVSGIAFLGSVVIISAYHGSKFAIKRNNLLGTLMWHPNYNVIFKPISGSNLPHFSLIPGKTTIFDINDFVIKQMSSSQQIRKQMLTGGAIGATALNFYGMHLWLNARDSNADYADRR